MDIDEARAKIMELWGRFASPYNNTDKETIASLYGSVLGKVFLPTSCQNCYHDAVIEILTYLRKHNTMAEERKYLLKAGAIINSPIFDNGKIYSNANLSDDVAERYLDMFPEQAVLFQRIPKKTAKTDAGASKAAKVGKSSKKTGTTAQKAAKTEKCESR